ncbi:MAG: cyclophilin-like fold protein [Dehalococcoidales bacterium]|nr:cyclophilin-like fold protein [Dehalococcoidales bacterium]
MNSGTSRRIIIRTSSIEIEAELIDCATSDAIWKALPLESMVNTWGQEIYFNIPVSIGLENGQEVVNAGDIAYWPPGKAFCIFFGPTPGSRGNEIRAASKVNVFGKVTSDCNIPGRVSDGEKVSIERVA